MCQYIDNRVTYNGCTAKDIHVILERDYQLCVNPKLQGQGTVCHDAKHATTVSSGSTRKPGQCPACAGGSNNTYVRTLLRLTNGRVLTKYCRGFMDSMTMEEFTKSQPRLLILGLKCLVGATQEGRPVFRISSFVISHPSSRI